MSGWVPVQRAAPGAPLAGPAPCVRQSRSCWSPAWAAARDAAVSHVPAVLIAASRSRRPQQGQTMAAARADAPLAQRPQRSSPGGASTGSSGADSSNCGSRRPPLHHQQQSEQQSMGLNSRWRHDIQDRMDATHRAGADSSAQQLMDVRRLAAAGKPEAAVHALLAPGGPAADERTGFAILQALRRKRASSSAMAWALKALPPEQDFYAMLLQHYRSVGSCKGVRQIAACLRAETRLPDSDLSRNTWFCLVYCLAAAGDSAAAGQAFGRMRAAGAWDSTDCAFPNVLLDACGDDVQSAILRYQEWQAEGFQGDLITFNTLLKTAMRGADAEAARWVHGAMLAAGVKGTDRTYNTLVKAFAYAAERAAPSGRDALADAIGGSSAESAWDLQKVQWIMEAGGYRPGKGSHVWGSLIMACGKAGQGAAVQALWADVRGLNGGPCPSLDLLHAFMHACNCCCQGWRALEAFREVCPAQLAATTHTFNVATAACHTAPGEVLPRDNLAIALQLLRELRAAGLRPDTVTYGSLVRLCERAGRGHTALLLFREMKAAGIKDSREVCIATVQAAGGSGLVEEAAAVWRSMVWGPARRRPDREAFLKACVTFRRAGDLQRALHAYSGMRKAGFRPCNAEFRALMLAATDAALSSRAAAGFNRIAAAASTDAADHGGAGGSELDLHGLSAAEARAAVLTRLSTLQELHRRGQIVRGDLVLVTGQGQHSRERPVLRDGVLRLLASLQLPSSGVEAQAPGTLDPPPLLDTGLRARHTVLRGQLPSGAGGGDLRAAAELWSHANAAALTELIILDWAASTSHAWLPHGTFSDGQSTAASVVPSSDRVRSAAGSAAAPAGIDDLFRAAWSGTRWMDHALQSAVTPVLAPAAIAAGLVAADMPSAAEALTSGHNSVSAPAAAGTSIRIANPGRIIVPRAALVRWLQAGVERAL